MKLSEGFIFTAIFFVALLMPGTYIIKRHTESVFVFLMSVSGVFCGLFMIRILDFGDISTNMKSILMLTLLPGIIINCIWAIKYITETRKKKIIELKKLITADLECKKNILYLEKENLEKELSANKSIHKLLLLLQSCNTETVNFYENQRLKEGRYYWNQLTKKIEINTIEINFIGARLAEVEDSNNYVQLLKMKRGGIL